MQVNPDEINNPDNIRAALDLYKTLRDNQGFTFLEQQARQRHDQCLALILSGQFPSNVGDMQSVLAREQLIGEAKGLQYMSRTLNSLITTLSEQLKEPASQQQTKENETPV